MRGQAMSTEAGMSLLEQLKKVPDPRIERTRRHELIDEELAEFKVTQCVRRLIAQNMGNLRLQG